MRKTISKILVFFLIFALTVLITLLYSLPKAVLIDRFLMSKGINLIASRAEESLFSIKLERVKVFYRNEEIANLKKITATVGINGLQLSGYCPSGHIEAHVSLNGNLDLKLDKVECLKIAKELNGNIRYGDSLYGSITAKGVTVRGVNIDSIELNFRGESFEGKIVYMGTILKGGGKIKLNPENIENSRISAQFKGSVGTLLVKGRLSNISAQIR